MLSIHYFYMFDNSSRSRFFFFNDTATTEIYTLSLHDALPIYLKKRHVRFLLLQFTDLLGVNKAVEVPASQFDKADRKSTRLNSSHGYISYAVFCLKKKKKPRRNIRCE